MGKHDFTFQLTSFHDAVLPQPLTFAPPYANLATDPEGFSRFWQFAHYAFRLPDPAKFPAFPGELPPGDRITLDRFVSSCRDLAGYTIMSAHDSVEMFPNAQSGSGHRATFSPSEVIRGASVLFRQLYADDSGSYRSVLSIVSKAHRTTQDRFTDQRADWLGVWRPVHGKLLQQRIEAIVARKSLRAQGAHESIPVPFENESPSELLSIFFYGDLIHWGESRPKHDSLIRDPLMQDLRKLRFLEAMIGLAHFYLGISVMLTTAFPKEKLGN
jgi:hypothetical protein